ncbi:MAG TPA: DUF4383 domain-containing protein [Bauldia sp.]|jgi:hypothetical protein
MTAKMAATVLGIVLVVVGLLGFVNNPVLGIFLVNPLHDVIHIVTGLVLLAGAYSSLGSSLALKIIGIVYAIVAVIGFFMVMDGMMLGMAMNEADKWLHVVLAIVILIAGFGLPDDKMTARAM